LGGIILSVNISFAGFVYDKDGVLSSDNVFYQSFFYPVNPASSAQKWNSVRTTETNGYYALNLGDGDFLSQTGIINSGDKVLIVFWTGSDNRLAFCVDIPEWSVLEITMDGSSVYNTDVQTMVDLPPNIIWSHNIPEDAYVNNTYSVVNNSNDYNSWTFNDTSLYQIGTKYGQDINSNSHIYKTDVSFGDGNTDEISGTSNFNYKWISPGIYTLLLEVFDVCGNSSSSSDSVKIKYEQPSIDIEMIPSNPNPNQQVSFRYSGTDTYNTIKEISWVINDSGSYGNTNTSLVSDRDVIVDHISGLGTSWYGVAKNSGAFTNPGDHDVNIVVLWNDGFEDIETSFTKTFNQRKFSAPALDFTQSPQYAIVGEEVTFTNTSTNRTMVGKGLPNHIEYTWTAAHENISVSDTDKNFSYLFKVSPDLSSYTIDLEAEWTDGWDTKTSFITKNLVFKTAVHIYQEECYYNMDIIGTSSDGTVDSYKWLVFHGEDETGPWNLLWESPKNIYQNNRSICFTSEGFYNIEGYVYGTGTTGNDNNILFIDKVCDYSTDVLTIWNGTGILDKRGDWNHHGVGNESSLAAFDGTNGLLVSANIGSNVRFTNTNNNLVDINKFNFLSFWINIRSWKGAGNSKIKLHSNQDNRGKSLNIVSYVKTNRLKTWQKVLINLERFDLSRNEDEIGWPCYVNELIFSFTDNVSFYIDDVKLIVGEMVPVPVNNPNFTTTYIKGIQPSS
jgi:hypothetical protein